MPNHEDKPADQNQDAIEHASTEQGSSVLQGSETPTPEVKVCKWKAEHQKHKDREAKKEVPVAVAQDKHGAELREGTKVILGNEIRTIVAMTNKKVLTIPSEETEENRELSLEQVSVEIPLEEVTRY